MSRKNISLHSEVESRAEAIIAKRGFAGLSDLLAALIREEFERRGLDDGQLRESGGAAADLPEAKPVSYRQGWKHPAAKLAADAKETFFAAGAGLKPKPGQPGSAKHNPSIDHRSRNRKPSLKLPT